MEEHIVKKSLSPLKEHLIKLNELLSDALPEDWMKVESLLNDHKNTNKFCDRDRLEDMYSAEIPSMSKQDIHTCLQYFHDKGQSMWYSDIDSLKDTVILDPGVFMRSLKALFSHDYEKSITFTKRPLYGTDSKEWLHEIYLGSRI